jgi:hypothetical protein
LIMSNESLLSLWCFLAACCLSDTWDLSPAIRVFKRTWDFWEALLKLAWDTLSYYDSNSLCLSLALSSILKALG